MDSAGCKVDVGASCNMRAKGLGSTMMPTKTVDLVVPSAVAEKLFRSLRAHRFQF